MSEPTVVEFLTTILRSLNYEVGPVDAAEIVWLARHLSPKALTPTSAVSLPGARTDQVAAPTPPKADGPAPVTRPNAAPNRQGLFASTETLSADAPTSRARSVRVPAVPALPNALALSRALRPLFRKHVSKRAWELDEAATADATTANAGVVTPVFRPGAERWFEVALVVDEAPSMQVWRRAIVEWRQLLVRHGGFRDLRKYGLRATDDAVDLVSESQRVMSPDVIADPSGRRLIMVVTDAASPQWRNARLRRTLVRWARLSPVVLVDVLPRRLWPLTSMGLAERAMRPTRAGAANVEWIVERRWWESAGVNAVPVPVITLEADQLARWSRALMFMSADGCSGTVIGPLAVHSKDRLALAEIEGLSARERVQRFKSVASADAYQLACYFSATQLVLPVLRIVQRTLMPSSGSGPLAEFLFSGLIYRVGGDQDPRFGDPERAKYEFHPGVREILLNQLQVHEVPRVAAAIQEYLLTHAGRSYDLSVRVLDENGDETISDDDKPFVMPTIELLERFGLRAGLEKPVPEPADEAEPEPTPKPTSDDYAIVVGISHYPGLNQPGGMSFDLLAPDRDADAIRDWLVSPAGGGLKPDNVVVLQSSAFPPTTEPYDARPSLSDIRRAFLQLRKKGLDANGNLSVPVGRRFYLYCSGHGFQQSTHRPALLTAEAVPDLLANFFVHGWVEWFRTAGYFKEYVTWVDCAMNSFTQVQPEQLPNRIAGGDPGIAFAALAASSRSTLESEMSDGQVHGVFTWTLLQGLNGKAAEKGQITGESLRRFLYNAMVENLPKAVREAGDVDVKPAVETDPGIVFRTAVPDQMYEVTLRLDAPDGTIVQIWSGQPHKVVKMTTLIGHTSKIQLDRGLYVAEVATQGFRHGFEVTGGDVDVSIADRGSAVKRAGASDAFALNVRADNPSALITVIDHGFERVLASTGLVTGTLAAGLYEVRVQSRSGTRITTQIVLFDRDTNLTL